MIYRCATCGKEFDALWPDLYRYKRGGTFLCSWGCLRKYDEEKGSDLMARTKKDGTPAKRPGPKPKEKVELVYDESIAEEYRREQEEKKENEKAAIKMMKDIIMTPDEERPMPKAEEIIPKAMRPYIRTMNYEGYAATAIKKDGIGEFYFDKRSGTIDWRNEYGEEVSLLPADWEKLAEEIPKMLKILGAD